MTLTEKAQYLQRLHREGPPLLLANVWEVSGALLLEQAGFPAVATSSAAVANSLGYADGERISRAEMLAAVARIAAAVAVPVTADMESGYGTSAEAMTAMAEELIAAGACGLNLEDADAAGLIDLELQAGKIRAVRAAGREAGVELAINARTDAFFLPPEAAPPGFDAFAETVRRARAYRRAGADCVFVPGLRDLSVIGRLLEASPGPVNILAGPGAPAVHELAAAGVRRISLGSGPYRAALGLLGQIAGELRESGGYSRLSEYALAGSEVNGRILASKKG